MRSLICAALSLLLVACTPRPGDAKGLELGAAQKQELQRFFAAMGKGTATILSVAPTETFWMHLSPVRGVMAKDSAYGRVAMVGLSRDGTLVYSYSVAEPNAIEKPDSPAVQDRTIKDALPKEKAFEHARPVLEYYGLSASAADYAFILKDADRGEAKELWPSRWIIKKEFSYQGIPCPQAFASFTISAVSGEILEVIYTPVVPPEATSGRLISAADALDAARKDPATLNAECGPESSLRKVIAPANGRFVSNEIHEPVKRYVCWEVPVTWKDKNGDRQASMWINAETGKLIGGNP